MSAYVSHSFVSPDASEDILHTIGRKRHDLQNSVFFGAWFVLSQARRTESTGTGTGKIWK